MQWFRNRKVGTKLLGAFGMASALIALVALVGFISTRSMNSSVDEAGHVLLPKVEAIGEVHHTMFEAVGDMRAAVLAEDPKEMSDDVTEGRRVYDQNGTYVDDYASRHCARPRSNSSRSSKWSARSGATAA